MKNILNTPIDTGLYISNAYIDLHEYKFNSSHELFKNNIYTNYSDRFIYAKKLSHEYFK